MTRILADLPDDDIEWLDKLAAELSKSRAQILREAVAEYKAKIGPTGKQDWIQRGAGLWRGRTDILDGIEYQRRVREDRTPYEEL